jgi:hypothetical protein
MKDWFSKLSPKMQIILVIVALVILFKSAGLKAEAVGEIASLNANGIVRSYPDSQYTTFANKLYYAMKGIGTYTEDIYSVMRKMKNDVDVIHLTTAFGDKDGYSLSEWLSDDLSSSEMAKVNDILSAKGITKSF